MNYREKILRMRELLGAQLKTRYPLSYPFLAEYAERLLIYDSSNRKLERRNPGRCNFAHTRTITDLKHVARTWIYYTLKRKRPVEQPSILISYNLQFRFPWLTERICQKYHVNMMASSFSAKIAASSPLKRFIKIDSIIYAKKIEKFFDRACSHLYQAVDSGTSLNLPFVSSSLAGLENCLREGVEKFGRLLYEHKVTQYICDLTARYEEIWICLACQKLGIPVKEICHGINAHNLEESDNVVPVNSDRLYVWSKQFYDNISLYEERDDKVRICGYPKFDSDQIEFFSRKYPRKRLITYFSQATYDVGSRTDVVIDAEFQREETVFREKMFAQLRKLKNEANYEIRIRYHQGERGLNDGCDRTEERRRLVEMGFEISENSFHQDLFESEICLGINTSCLFEAFVVGKAVYQLDFVLSGNVHFKEIPIISTERIFEIVKNGVFKGGVRHDQLMDLNWFLSDLLPEPFRLEMLQNVEFKNNFNKFDPICELS